MSEKKATHVDDFVMEWSEEPELRYAKFFLFLKRLPAMEQAHFADSIKEYTLFAKYQGTWHRVTGASRMGDVWLTTDFNQDTGYQKRVDVDDLSGWRREWP